MGSRFNIGDIIQLTEHLQSFVFHSGRSYCPTCDVELEKNSLSSQIEKKASGAEAGEVIYLLTSYGEYGRLFPGQFPQKGWSIEKGLINLSFGTDEEIEYDYVLYSRVKAKNIEKMSKDIKAREKQINELYLKVGDQKIIKLKNPKCWLPFL